MGLGGKEVECAYRGKLGSAGGWGKEVEAGGRKSGHLGGCVGGGRASVCGW